MYFFTADAHHGHTNIIKFCNRPFKNTHEMGKALIANHNEVVSEGDTTIHAGDFAWTNKKEEAYSIVKKLNGKHIFLRGSHDRWQRNSDFHHEIWEKNINGVYIVACHYAMRVWPRSHWNSIHLYGHSHNKLPGIGKSMDIGVDTNNFYPYSLDEILKIMETKPDNFNLIKK